MKCAFVSDTSIGAASSTLVLNECLKAHVVQVWNGGYAECVYLRTPSTIEGHRRFRAVCLVLHGARSYYSEIIPSSAE
jgi:hypothetical protein